jgi:hypothetical protein
MKLFRLQRSSFWGNSFRESQVADVDSGLVALLIGWIRRKVEDLGSLHSDQDGPELGTFQAS